MDIISKIAESVEQAATPAMSPEQLPYQRVWNQQNPVMGDDAWQELDPTFELYSDNIGSQQSVNNMTSSTRQDALSPDDLRAKSDLQANYLDDGGSNVKDIKAESFVGTADIAITPSVLGGTQSPKKKSEKKMSRKDRPVNEWEAKFAGRHTPGQGNMESPTGKGLQRKELGNIDYDNCCGSDLEEVLDDPFGADFAETAAMCDVDENGVENKPQGVHKSTHGDPKVDFMDSLGKDWPSQPKNSGGANERLNEWTPENISKLMEEFDWEEKAQEDSCDDDDESCDDGDGNCDDDVSCESIEKITLSENLAKQGTTAPAIPDQPGPQDVDDLGQPLGRKQKNKSGETPVIAGSGTLKENAEKIAFRIRKGIQEASQRMNGKFKVRLFSIVEDKKIKTPERLTLVEAASDVEELLQFYNHNNVFVVAKFVNESNEVVRQNRINMPKIKRRGPLVSEGKAIFRFSKHAQAYAKKLVSEGKVCKLAPHKWGSSVIV